jgi:hypothetical protein
VLGNSRTARRTAYWIALTFIGVLFFGQSAWVQAETFRWKDDSDRTHYADSYHGVPEEYRSQAEPVDGSLDKPIRVLPSSDPNAEAGAPLNWKEFEEALQKEAAREGGDFESESEEETAPQDFDFGLPGGNGGGPDPKAVFDKLTDDLSLGALVGMVLGMVLSFSIFFFIAIFISGVILQWACTMVGEAVELRRTIFASFLQALAASALGIATGFIAAMAMSEAAVAESWGFQGFSMVAGLLVDALVIRLMICQSYLKSIGISILRIILIIVLVIGLGLFVGFFGAIIF